MSEHFITACTKSEVLSQNFIDTVTHKQEILKVLKRKIMKYYIGIQHLDYFSLGISQICLKLYVQSLSEENFSISELKPCTFLVLHSLIVFVKTSSGQAGSTSEFKILATIRISQNSFIVSS